MKRLFRGILLALIAALCLNSGVAAAEGSLLTERMGQAYEAGRQVEVSLGAQMGMGLALFVPEETFAALSKLLNDTRIQACFAKTAEGGDAMGLSVHIGEVEVLSGAAVLLGDGAAVTTSLLPGITVMIPLEGLTETAMQQSLPVEIDAEAAAILMRAYERYFGIVTDWALTSEGMVEMLDGPIAGTQVRSEAAGAVKVRVSGAQIKDLLVRLTQAFERDGELQAALEAYNDDSGEGGASVAEIASELSGVAQQIQPTGGLLALDVYVGSESELVGLDVEMEPLFQGIPGTVYLRYDRLDEDGYLAHDFQGRVGLAQGGQAAARVSYVVEEPHLEDRITTNMLLRGMFQATGEEPINQVTLTDDRETTRGADQEHMTDVISLTMESLAPDGTALEESMPLSAAIQTGSVTNAGAGDDFGSGITVSVQAFGMEFAALGLSIASADYVPADTSGNMVIDLATATPEVQATLMEALETGLQLAMAKAMQAAPPEILAMLG